MTNDQKEFFQQAFIRCFGLKLFGTDRLMFQCESCNVYELSSHNLEDPLLTTWRETGIGFFDMEKIGWRQINNKWYCIDCLKIK